MEHVSTVLQSTKNARSVLQSRPERCITAADKASPRSLHSTPGSGARSREETGSRARMSQNQATEGQSFHSWKVGQNEEDTSQE